jgi:hypothetical protein
MMESEQNLPITSMLWVLVMAVTCKRVSEICAAAEFCSVLFDIL